MATRIELTVTDTFKTRLREGWESERENWGDDDVDRCLAALDVVPTGTVIKFSEDEEIDETVATPEQLITLGWEYFGFSSHVAPVEYVPVD